MSRLVRETERWLYKIAGLLLALLILGLLVLGLLVVIGYAGAGGVPA